jgi:hypothetical protein
VIRPFLYHYNRGDQIVFISLWQVIRPFLYHYNRGDQIVFISLWQVIRPFLYHYDRGDQIVFISLWQRWSDRFYIIITEVIRSFLYHGRGDQTVFISLCQRWSDSFYIIMAEVIRLFLYHYGRGDQTVFEGDISWHHFHVTKKSLYQYLILYSKYILRYNNIQLLTGFEDNRCFIWPICWG